MLQKYFGISYKFNIFYISVFYESVSALVENLNVFRAVFLYYQNLVFKYKRKLKYFIK